MSAVRNRYWVLLALVLVASWTAGGAPPRALAAAARPSQQWTNSAGGTFVSSDPDAQTWTIGNDQINVRFRLTTTDFVLDAIVDPSTGQTLTPAPAPDSTVTINGATVALGSRADGWALVDVSASDTATGVQLAFTFRSPRVPVTVVRTYACYAGSPTLEAWTTFTVTGGAAATISNFSVWQLTVPATTLYYALGLRSRDTGVPPDYGFTLENRSISPGAGVVLAEQNRSTEQYLPMIAADAGADEFFGGIMWSGSWQIAVDPVAAGMRAVATVPRVSVSVEAGHSLATPHGFVGVAQGGRSAVSRALQEFIVQGLRGGRPFHPLVTYNTWYAYGTDIDEEAMKGEMSDAAARGVELFVIDAGWYLGAGSGTAFDSGLGTWEVDPARFPDGLAAMRDYAHSLGMQFGLWVEPERVDRRTLNQPGRAREAWLAQNNGSYQATQTAQVCLASAAARQWVLDTLTRLLDDVRPDYLKWDNNLWVNCNRSGHGHGSTDGNFAHISGLYDILASLRERYPDMAIENCAQGGNRLDFGILRYTETAWMDDRTTPSAHVRHNLEGLMTFFPPAYLLSFAVDEIGEPFAQAPDLPLFLRSRMPGILGLTYKASDLGESDLEALAREIAAYKQLRGTIADASGSELTRQAAQEDAPAWDAVQEIAAGSGDGILFAFQNDPGVEGVRVQPQRLDPAAAYAVTALDGTVLSQATGAALMADGIQIDASPDSAAHVVLLRKADGPAAAMQGSDPGPQ